MVSAASGEVTNQPTGLSLSPDYVHSMSDEDLLSYGDLDLSIADEDKTVPEQYEHLPKKDELSADKLDDIQPIAETFAFTTYLSEGGTLDAGETFTRFYEGDTKAEALGNAYLTRDQIRDNGRPCEAEYIEPHHRRNGCVCHKIKFTTYE
jgi:hypothetical protein